MVEGLKNLHLLVSKVFSLRSTSDDYSPEIVSAKLTKTISDYFRRFPCCITRDTAENLLPYISYASLISTTISSLDRISSGGSIRTCPMMPFIGRNVRSRAKSRDRPKARQTQPINLNFPDVGRKRKLLIEKRFLLFEVAGIPRLGSCIVGGRPVTRSKISDSILFKV